MKQTVIFIDDEENSRFIYGTALQAMYGAAFELCAMEPEPTIEAMLLLVESPELDVVAIVIDEKLQVGGAANYVGSQFAQAMREYDTKLPLYILTSEMGLINEPFGAVEYVIDKSLVLQENYQKQCATLMRRHIRTFCDIRSERAIRFDELLRKSLNEQLTEAEVVEYHELDFLRIRKIVAVEPMIGGDELNKQDDLIKQIELNLEKAKAY